MDSSQNLYSSIPFFLKIGLRHEDSLQASLMQKKQ